MESEADVPRAEGADNEASVAAQSLALAGASRAKADAFLDEHIRTMRREDRIRHGQLRIRHFGDLLRLAAEIFLALLVILIAAAIGTAMWNAAHDRGLVVEAFSVPPDMAGRGLTGQVVAARLLDKLIAMQNQTQSARAASSYTNNWGNDIKVQIPDTGISLSEVYRYMRGWLGAETHITGDVFREANGIAVTARASGSPGETFAGSDKDIDALLQKAAEAVYARTQPYRYAVYLMDHKRKPEAERTFRALAKNGSSGDRAWAWVGLANLADERGDPAQSLALVRNALALRPGFIMVVGNSATWEGQLDHWEAQYQRLLKAVDVLKRSNDPEVTTNPTLMRMQIAEEEATLAALKGDFRASLDQFRDMQPGMAEAGLDADISGTLAQIYAALRNGKAAALLLPALKPPVPPQALDNAIRVPLSTGERFTQLPAEAKLAVQMTPGRDYDGLEIARDLWSDAAEAMALTGDVAGAEKLAARTPLDCDSCVSARGRVAMLAHDWRDADRWFALVSARSPSIPFADTDWGESLLRRGSPDKAIEKFRAAHDKGPHFADPLEMWGEALMLQNRSDQALAKFEAANAEAPEWGRLHLKWGEALLYVGKRDEAKKQFALAARLSLFPEERARLIRDTAPAARGG